MTKARINGIDIHFQSRLMERETPSSLPTGRAATCLAGGNRSLTFPSVIDALRLTTGDLDIPPMNWRDRAATPLWMI